MRLDAFGLKARLTGDLKVAQDKQGLGLNGQINIPEGRFHAYGQDLIVRKGELAVLRSTDQPLLNIEAIRNPEGRKTTSLLAFASPVPPMSRRRRSSLDPAMSQQEALSYLLRGQGLDSGQATARR